MFIFFKIVVFGLDKRLKNEGLVIKIVKRIFLIVIIVKIFYC